MAAAVPDSHLDLLTLPLYVSVVTLMPDGTPQASIVWRMWDAPHILVSSPEHTQKTRNVQRDPRITFLMVDPHNPFRYLEIRGEVTAVRADAGYEFLERITQYYVQKPYYGGMEPVENRGREEHVVFEIEIRKVRVHS